MPKFKKNTSPAMYKKPSSFKQKGFSGFGNKVKNTLNPPNSKNKNPKVALKNMKIGLKDIANQYKRGETYNFGIFNFPKRAKKVFQKYGPVINASNKKPGGIFNIGGKNKK